MATNSRRLFVGVALNWTHKQMLHEMARGITMVLEDGRPTPRDNFHITLKFLGETQEEKLEEVKAAIDRVSEEMELFLSRMSDMGEFTRRDRSLIWMGSTRRGMTHELRDLVERELSDIVSQEEKDYIPHITLVRDAIYGEKYPNLNALTKHFHFPEIPVLVDRLTLFESVKENGETRYVELYQSDFRIKDRKFQEIF